MHSSEATSSVNNNRFRKTVYMFIFPLAGVISRLNLECSCFLWHTSFEFLLAQCLCNRFSLFVCSVFFYDCWRWFYIQFSFSKGETIFICTTCKQVKNCSLYTSKEMHIANLCDIFQMLLSILFLVSAEKCNLKIFFESNLSIFATMLLRKCFFATKFQD